MEHTLNKFGAVILVGGESSRMGVNKYQLPYQGKTFIDHITTSFAKLNPCYSVHQLLADLDMEQQIIDQTKRIGPLGGIYSSLIASQNEYTFICSCDLPKVSEELVMYMLGQCSLHQTTIIASVDGKVIPTFAIYHHSVQKQIAQAIQDGDFKLMNLLKKINHHVVEIPSSFANQLININNPTDYRQLLGPYIFAVSGFKNSGKTTLINQLISKFKDDQLRVACLKHDGHDFEIDPSTDTGKFIQSKADYTTIYSATKSQTTSLGELNIDKWLAKLVSIDIVIIEGMKASTYPKIVINNGENFNYPNCLYTVDQSSRNDIEAIYTKIIEEYYAR